VCQEQQRDDESLRPIAAQEDLGKVFESDPDRREGDPEHRHEEPKGERGRGPVPGGLRCDLEEAEEVRDPSDEDDEDTADEERKLRNARPGSPHAVVESGEAHLVTAVRRFSEGRVPKAFMAHPANRPFRSRSLVRSRIGAFRASDAGSNPAGSMYFIRRGWFFVLQLPYRNSLLSAPCESHTSWVRRAFTKFRTRQLPSI